MTQKLITIYKIRKQLDEPAALINMSLVKLGFQVFDDDNLFALTEEGKVHGQYYYVKRRDIESRKIKWDENIIPEILSESKKIVSYKEESRLLVKTRHAYVLELENNCFYVGAASNLKKRLKEHFTRNPRIKWIIKNPIVKVAYVEAIRGGLYDNYELENKLALGLAKTLGVDRVRGGKLSGHPDKAPSGWKKIIEEYEPVSKEIFKYWTDQELNQFIS